MTFDEMALNDIDSFFNDASSVSVDGVTIKAWADTYYDDNNIERSAIVAKASDTTTVTKNSTVSISGTSYRVAGFAIDKADPAIKIIILGGEL